MVELTHKILQRDIQVFVDNNWMPEKWSTHIWVEGSNSIFFYDDEKERDEDFERLERYIRGKNEDWNE